MPYIRKHKFNYPVAVIKAAKAKGYPGPETLIFFEYHIFEKNMREVGEMLVVDGLSMTGAAIRTHLVQWVEHGFKFRRQGGNNCNPGIANPRNFLHRCLKCGKRFKGTAWMPIYRKMKEHKCKEGKDG